jgi:ACS family hexuronate transporter-like MFS transporter
MLRAVKWWLPVTAMTALSLLSYVDRTILAQLSPTILREQGLTAEQYGWIIDAFSVAYLVGSPVWGRLLDRFGLRAGLALAVALWTGASASHAFASTAATFALARAALGFGEGATFPAGLRTATQTLRPAERARGLAVAYSGGSLGAVLTPIIATPIARRWGWRGTFFCTGFFGVAWLALWALVSRDARLKAPSQNERPEATPSLARTDAPRLTDPSVWGFMAAYAFGGLPLGFVLYSAPIYLGRHLGWDQETLGHVLWLPPLGWEVGYFFWGWVIDHAGGSAIFRRLFAGLAALALPLALTPLASARAAILALLFLAMFVSAGFVIVSLTETTRRHAERHAGYLAGLGVGAWSGLMMLMPVFGHLFDRGEFRSAFMLAAVCPAVGWLIWLASSRMRDPPRASL